MAKPKPAAKSKPATRAKLKPALTGAKGTAKSVVDKWTREAQAYDPDGPPMPLVTLLDESAQVARFVRRHLDPSRSPRYKDTLPGLRQAPRLGIDERVAADIEELTVAIREVNARYLRELDTKGRFPAHECNLVLRRLVMVPVLAKALRGVWPMGKGVRRSERHGKVGAALAVITKFAAEHPQAFRNDKSRKIQRHLDGVPDLMTRVDRYLVSVEQSLLLRDRLIAALADRVARVRMAARSIFRDYPELVREATSAYERERRANLRARGEGQAAPQNAAPAPKRSARPLPAAPVAKRRPAAAAKVTRRQRGALSAT